MYVIINYYYYLCRSMFRYVTLQHRRDSGVLEVSCQLRLQIMWAKLYAGGPVRAPGL